MDHSNPIEDKMIKLENENVFEDEQISVILPESDHTDSNILSNEPESEKEEIKKQPLFLNIKTENEDLEMWTKEESSNEATLEEKISLDIALTGSTLKGKRQQQSDEDITSEYVQSVFDMSRAEYEPQPTLELTKRMQQNRMDYIIYKKIIAARARRKKETKCTKCGEEFQTKFELKAHEICHNVTVKQPQHKCYFCDKDFAKRVLLLLHQRISHSKKEPRHKCRFCNEGFANKVKLVRHERSHTKDQPRHKCRLCDEGFAKKVQLVRHERSHTKAINTKRHACSVCARTFGTPEQLRKHELRQHVCSVCDTRCSTRPGLLLHMRRHTGEKPLQCSYCGKTFRSYHACKDHELTHTGEKAYICDQCPKAFARLGALKTHQRVHTGEKPYKCGHCEKRFAAFTSKRSHEQMHSDETPYKCSYCDKCFKTPSSKYSHQLMHDIKRHKCSYCEKRFRMSTQKCRHEKVHTGEKPHTCSHCGKGFITTSGLQVHLRRHHATAVNPRPPRRPAASGRRVTVVMQQETRIAFL